MQDQEITKKLDELKNLLEGNLHTDSTLRKLYATDASAYREMPLGVALPRSGKDIKTIVEFAGIHGIPLIPRAAGTSLAGQVVGNGLVVDISNLNRIIEVNKEAQWVRLQPGVIRDELNFHLEPHGLFFGPETSTANRAMMGGMVGNNSCGSNSIVYGSTRNHLLSVRAILSDGSEAEFKALDKKSFEDKCAGKDVSGELEQNIYKGINEILSDPENRKRIRAEYPKRNIPRRNNGYALDLLMEAEPFGENDEPFNFCKLIAGSEGTLAFMTEIKLNLVPLPPKAKLLVACHFESINESLEANLIALKYGPLACELIDRYIIDCTANNINQRENRFFIKGTPGAILVVELSRNRIEDAEKTADEMIAAMKAAGYGYHFPKLTGNDTNKVWELRKAGLGLLSNIPGDAKPVPVIEDTAVDVQELPAYIREFNLILKKYDLSSVHYAHAGSGELHLRPILNLKKKEDTVLFRTILEEIAALVKKYHGSLSGEHGDGRLRGEFIRFMLGEENYQLIRRVKDTWDPKHIFNPGKIVDTPPMNTFLRYTPGQETPEIETIFNFDQYKGILRTAELCNGSGDCRKTHLSGGTMCPSYMATREEKNTTRARANILREILTHSGAENPFDSEEIKEVMDLCLSCKGCKSECPSNVDVAKMKGEFLQHYYDANGIPFRTRLIAGFNALNALASRIPGLYNFMVSGKPFSGLIKKISGFAPKRSMPKLYKTTLKRWYKKNKNKGFGVVAPEKSLGKIWLFCDEFTNYNDTQTGITAIKLLTCLGYEVEIPEHDQSGRALISKGLLRKAKKVAERNVHLLGDIVTEKTPLLGVEPSAILSFRDEYPDLMDDPMIEKARKLGENALMVDEFLDREMEKGRIDQNLFTKEKKLVKLHGHCQQKAIASQVPTKRMLSFPENYEVQIIPSGCCGMAGSFGFEKEHYDLSMKIGELVLFPEVRKQPGDVLIAAPGTSCRHQIADGTGLHSRHPVEILYEALL